jgi:hypothetical protein
MENLQYYPMQPFSIERFRFKKFACISELIDLFSFISLGYIPVDEKETLKAIKHDKCENIAGSV